MNTVEIIFGDSAYYTLKKSKLSKHQIIKFNTLFSISDLSNVKDYKLITKKELSYNQSEYSFEQEIKNLKTYVLNGDKIRIWSSHKDIEPYLLLLYICNLFYKSEVNLYVTYSDELNIVTPSVLTEKEFEELIKKEHKISKKEMEKNSRIWQELANNNREMRILKNGKVLSVSYSYFDDLILNILKNLGQVKISRIVGELIGIYHIRDIEYLYFIDELINKNKIKIVEKSKERHFLDIIDIVK